MSQIEILSQEVDTDNGQPSYYRMLDGGKYFRYITIDPGTLDEEDLSFPPALLEKLPAFPAGDWNSGRIARAENGVLYFVETIKKGLPSIDHIWHEKSFDYLSLQMKKRLGANVHLVTAPHVHPENRDVIAKFARFPWEVERYALETKSYEWIKGHGIGPQFLGHLTEDGRVIGFLMEKLEGRHATIADLPACKEVVGRLHALGILHGDLNKHNFLITGKDARIIDFETAKLSSDRDKMYQEAQTLEKELLDESGRGGMSVI
ncbi:hypothetical protein TWF481_002164 [Arthrobotrys musiformis]|uniref:Alpha-galactosidase A n=1 Tax=Arthrobotrys musiformis TaxID=47236 RepID=A0AAV9VSJ2_9PEZI